MANKLLGQHFLKDRSVVRQIIRALEPGRGQTIFEIGPGHGELTCALAETCKKNGGDLVAIEKDRALAEKLQIDGVRMIAGDALEFFTREFAAPESYKITGNIPYYLTGHLLRLISELERKPARCVFMVQKEVAERIVALPPKMNRLAAIVRFWAEPKVVGTVPKKYFLPVPEVDSAILLLDHKKQEAAGDEASQAAHYYATVRTLFAQPRKTVLNNLSGKNAQRKEDIVRILEKIHITPESRPQNLTVDDIAKIAQSLPHWG